MDNGLDIIVWNVEHGSAIFAKTPNNRSIVLDAGSSPRFSPAHWLTTVYQVNSLDLFILSHADSDHLTDIENVDKLLHPCVFYRNRSVPKELIYPTYPPQVYPLNYYYEFDNRFVAAVPEGYDVDTKENWGGVTIKVFRNSHPQSLFDNINDYSLVTILRYGNLTFLFPGDLEPAGWEVLLQDSSFVAWCKPIENEIRILVAPHHGRKSGVYHPFLKLFAPHLTIISDAYGVQYTDYDSYCDATLGFNVYDSGKGKTETRLVVSTKMNNYVKVSSGALGVSVTI